MLPDELTPGEGFDIEALAYDMSQLPDNFDLPPEQLATALIEFFSPPAPEALAAGGTVEPMADNDGVLITSPERHADEPHHADRSTDLTHS